VVLPSARPAALMGFNPSQVCSRPQVDRSSLSIRAHVPVTPRSPDPIDFRRAGPFARNRNVREKANEPGTIVMLASGLGSCLRSVSRIRCRTHARLSQ
jgi:hypothetical protein